MLEFYCCRCGRKNLASPQEAYERFAKCRDCGGTLVKRRELAPDLAAKILKGGDNGKASVHQQDGK